ncbi:hypothetical protein [Methanopyrus kandleri]
MPYVSSFPPQTTLLFKVLVITIGVLSIVSLITVIRTISMKDMEPIGIINEMWVYSIEYIAVSTLTVISVPTLFVSIISYLILKQHRLYDAFGSYLFLPGPGVGTMLSIITFYIRLKSLGVNVEVGPPVKLTLTLPEWVYENGIMPSELKDKIIEMWGKFITPHPYSWLLIALIPIQDAAIASVDIYCAITNINESKLVKIKYYYDTATAIAVGSCMIAGIAMGLLLSRKKYVCSRVVYPWGYWKFNVIGCAVGLALIGLQAIFWFHFFGWLHF